MMSNLNSNRAEPGKLRTILIVAALCLTYFAGLNDMVIIPVLDKLLGDFEGTPIAVLNYIVSGPMMACAIMTLVFGKLIEVVSKKTLTVASFAVFSAAVIFMDAIHNPYWMVVMRTLVGICIGALYVAPQAIVVDLFPEERKRSVVMGITLGGSFFLGAILGWVSGIVASMGWRLVFRLYWVSIPILVMLFVFLPADKPGRRHMEKESSDENDSAEENLSSGSEKMPWQKILSLCGASLIYNMLYCVIYYQIALLITEKGVGDSAYNGRVSAFINVGAFVGTTAFGFYYNRLKRFTILIGFAGIALCFWVFYVSESAPVIAIACAVLGVMYGLGLSYYLMRATVIVPISKVPQAISLGNFTSTVGVFLSTYFATTLQAVMGSATLTAIMPIIAGILAVGAVLSVIFSIKDRVAQTTTT
jgi:MFS family permease